MRGGESKREGVRVGKGCEGAGGERKGEGEKGSRREVGEKWGK